MLKAQRRRDTLRQQIADEWREMVAALEAMLDWALSNRGSAHEFVTCRSNGDIHHPALDAARTALARTKGSDDE